MANREILILLVTFVIWALTLKKPFWGLLYFFLFSTLTFQRLYGNLEPFHLIKITSIVILISWLLHSRNQGIKRAPQFYLMVGLFFVMCISRWNAGVPILGHRYMELYKIALLFLVMLNLITTEERLKIFMWVMLISYTTLAFVARYNWTETPYYWWNKGDFALALVSVIPLTFFFIFSEKKILTKLEGACYCLVLALILLRTGSRGGFLGLAVVCLLLLMHKPAMFKKYLILIPIVLILLSRVTEKEVQRYETIKVYETQKTALQRIGAWRVGLKMLGANPIIGIGAGEFSARFFDFADGEELEMVGGWSNAHSMYVQIAAETGLLGLIIFLILIMVTFRNIWKLWLLSKRRAKPTAACQMGIAVAIGLIGYLVSGLFLNVAYTIQLYILIALIAIAKKLAEEQNIKNAALNKVKIEFPHFNIISRTLLLGICVYLAIY